MLISKNKWYTYGESDMVLCGACVIADLERTRTGELTGDSAVTADMIFEIPDTGLQCDGCLEQSAEYDNLED